MQILKISGHIFPVFILLLCSVICVIIIVCKEFLFYKDTNSLKVYIDTKLLSLPEQVYCYLTIRLLIKIICHILKKYTYQNVQLVKL